MTLKEYLLQKELSQKAFLDSLPGEAKPSKQAINRYVNGDDMPGLEVALLIAAATDGEVQPKDMLLDRKRKYTNPGDSIYSFDVATDMEDLI